jgi:NAD(P)-dependent dehydrogenase (short-subunit alcohol dehydrogenase family)
MAVLLVTGSGRGIGADIAILAAERGWDVAVNYVGNQSAAEGVCARIEDIGRRALAVQADVSDPSAVEAMFAQVRTDLGRISGLVNNAGISLTKGSIDVLDVELVRKAYEVNFFGTFLCCRSAIAHMSTECGGRGGAIVNISSAAARLGSAGSQIHYAASKAAIDVLTIGLAKEQAAAGIRVNAVRPGITRTDLAEELEKLDPGWYERVSDKVPLGRVAEVRDISTSVLWLLSDEAGYTTGAILDVSGGLATP